MVNNNLASAVDGDVILRFIIAINNALIFICYFVILLSMYYIYKKNTIKILFINSTFEKEKYIVKTLFGAFYIFIFTCSITHLGNAIRYFWEEQYSRLTLIFICTVASLYTVTIIFIYGNDVLKILDKIEITDIGSTEELKNAFNIALCWSIDMVSIHESKSLKFLHVNQSCNAFGYTENNIKSLSLFDIVHSEDIIILKNMQNNTYNIKEEYIFIYRIKTIDNIYIYVEASCQKGKLSNQDVFFIITRNIQQRIEKFDHDLNTKNEQVRVETNCVQAMLLAHDIRTSLSVFEMGISNLQHQDGLSISNVSVLKTLENSTKYMTFIINRIVDTSRVLQGEKPIPIYKDINIKDIVNDCLNILEEYPKSVSINASFHFDTSTIIFRCDYQWLWSILINLLTNACDNTIYGYIDLHVRYENSDSTKKPLMSFEVHDTGIGIDSKDRDKLFYPFATLTNKLNPKHGIGIGLYTCAWKTRFLNGTYKVEPNINGGSIFVIKLPINERCINLQTNSISDTNSKDKSNSISNSIVAKKRQRKSFIDAYDNYNLLKIIIVDDTISFRKLFRRNLEMHGITDIDEAENGLIGMEMLKKNNYDIAFIDYYMPLKNGEECVSEYRIFENEEGIYPRTVCVLVTADNMASTSSVIVKNIFDNVINKPINMKLIMSIVEDFFINNLLKDKKNINKNNIRM